MPYEQRSQVYREKIVGDDRQFASRISLTNTFADGKVSSPPAEYSGSPEIKLTDCAAQPLRDMTVYIHPIQGGSGDPSLDNVRRIIGAQGLVYCINDEELNVSWSVWVGNSGTVYGGRCNLKSRRVYVSHWCYTTTGSETVTVVGVSDQDGSNVYRVAIGGNATASAATTWSPVCSHAKGIYGDVAVEDMRTNEIKHVGNGWQFDFCTDHASIEEFSAFLAEGVQIVFEGATEAASAISWNPPALTYRNNTILVDDYAFDVEYAKVIELDSKTIQTMTLNEVVSSARTLTAGTACSNKLTVKLINPPTDINYETAEFIAEAGLKISDTEYEWIPLGKFYVTDLQTKNEFKNLTLTAYDGFCKMNGIYTPGVTGATTYQAVYDDLRSQLAANCGVVLQEMDWGGEDSAPFPAFPALKGITYTQAAAYLAGCRGYFANFNRDGKLEFILWFWENDYGYIPRTLQYQDGFIRSAMQDMEVTSVVTGTKENPLTFGDGSLGAQVSFENPYITEEMAASAADEMLGQIFAPSSVKWRGDPALQAGDAVRVEDKNGDFHQVFVMEHTTVIGGGCSSTIECRCESEKKNALTKGFVSTGQRIEQMYTDMEQAILDATSKITGNKGGFVILYDEDGDGKPDNLVISDTEDIMSETANVWRWNNGGLGFSSTGYNGTYGEEAAITRDGKICADYIQTGKLSANFVRTGKLLSENETSYFDLGTGELHVGGDRYYTEISDGSIKQYLKTFNGVIGGLVPTAIGTDARMTLWYDSNNSAVTSVDISARLSGGEFAPIARFSEYGEIVYGEDVRGYTYSRSGDSYTDGSYISCVALGGARLNGFPSVCLDQWNDGGNDFLRVEFARNLGEAQVSIRAAEKASGTTTYSNILELGEKMWWHGGLWADGEIFATGNVSGATITNRSDRKIKKNIHKSKTESALDVVNALVLYDYELTQDDTVVNMGLMADEAPEQILGADRESINLYSYCGLLAKAVQELSAKLEQKGGNSHDRKN